MATTKSRIQLKSDTEANWSKAINFVPLKGEVIIYSADDTHPFFRLKIGDGTTYVVDLPFIDAATVNGHGIWSNTTAHWNSLRNYRPNAGDVIIYTDYNGAANIKVGDGNAYLVDLPFIIQVSMEDFRQHIENTNIHTTPEEKEFWNNKINCNDEVIGEALVIHRN